MKHSIRNTIYKIRNTKIHRFLFYLLILFLPTQLGLHVWPEWSLVLGRRIDYLSPTLYVTDILVMLTLLSWLWGYRNCISYYVVRSMYGKFVYRIPYTVLGVLIFVFLNTIFSLRWQVAAYSWMKVMEYGIFALYIIKTKPHISRVSWFLSLAILYSSVIAIMQFVLQHSIGGPLWLLGERTFTSNTPGIAQYEWCQGLGASGCQLLLRAYGTFPHPNVLGGFLAVSLPFIVYRISYIVCREKQLQKLWKNMLYVITLIIGIIALIVTFSRSAWVVVGVGISYTVCRILYIRNMHQVVRYMLYSVFFIFFVGILYLYLPLSEKNESIVIRLALNESAISIWRQYPWFGVGLGNFLVALPASLPSQFIYFLQPVHNIYLLLFSELGIVGVGLLVLLIYFFVFRIQYRVSREKQYEIRNTQYVIPLYILLLLGFVDHYPLTLQQGQLLFVLCISYFVLCKRT